MSDLQTRALWAKLAGVDAPRDEPRIKVSLTCRTNGYIMQSPNGEAYCLSPGDHTVEIYQSQLKQIESDTETASEAELAAAKAYYESALAAWLKAHEGADERRAPLSFEGCFQALYFRGLRPLSNVKVLPAEKVK